MIKSQCKKNVGLNFLNKTSPATSRSGEHLNRGESTNCEIIISRLRGKRPCRAALPRPYTAEGSTCQSFSLLDKKSRLLFYQLRFLSLQVNFVSSVSNQRRFHNLPNKTSQLEHHRWSFQSHLFRLQSTLEQTFVESLKRIKKAADNPLRHPGIIHSSSSNLRRFFLGLSASS